MYIKKLVEKIIEDKKITRKEHEELNRAVMADGKIDKDEEEEIKKIFTLIESGEVEVILD
ncbi:hypothetical protein C4588_02665 [Candidatus Parcubacteria bacterium]|nr:MAG: hypothetical protein C4588_02665 [Candidatus Parcubacteria bacterium]